MRRVRITKPRGMEPANKPAPTPINDDRPEFNLTGSLEEWDDAVFRSAKLFRVFRFHVDGSRDTFAHEDFAVAMRAAIDAMRGGWRVVVYAVTPEGRSQALQPKRWEHYASIYNMSKRGHH